MVEFLLFSGSLSSFCTEGIFRPVICDWLFFLIGLFKGRQFCLLMVLTDVTGKLCMEHLFHYIPMKLKVCLPFNM